MHGNNLETKGCSSYFLVDQHLKLRHNFLNISNARCSQMFMKNNHPKGDKNYSLKILEIISVANVAI